VPDTPVELDELVDLKMLPAWVHEPAPGERYSQHHGEDRPERRERGRRDKNRRDSLRPRDSKTQSPPIDQRRPSGDRFRSQRRDRDRRQRRHDRPAFAEQRRNKHHLPERPLPPIAVKFLPRPAALESVVAQIKSGTVAYSLFALARLFLEKPARYELKLTAPAESPLFQLGEHGAVSADRDFLERSAFRFAKSDFYRIDVTETEPIKGNFTNVARCRLSATVLGPTNHHDYQRRLRNLYEQRFSRRMSFPEYQHKIEIVSDPAVVDKWKEEARKVTTYSTSCEEPPQTFSTEAEAERHFRQHYFDGLIQAVAEVSISTLNIADRTLRRVVEEAWNRETKSPSMMMQELAARFRESSLHIFRHRRGMLFVTPIYPRAFTNEQTAVSSQVRTIVEAIAASPRIGRKELADKLIVDQKPVDAAVPAANEAERAKLALASDLLWLISAGHVIEFNDGSLDLPRAKAKPKEKEENVAAAVPATPKPDEGRSASEKEENAKAAAAAADKEARVEAGAPPAEEEDAVAAVSAAEKSSIESRPIEKEESAEIGGS
jgi:hypothetical protein